MKVTINEKLLQLISKNEWERLNIDKHEVKSISFADLDAADLQGKVVIHNANLKDLELLIKMLELRKLKKLDTVYFLVDDVEAAKNTLKSMFKIVRAAGGLVLKNDQVLMIYRLGKWDLPKGKLNGNEKARVAAEREIEEECSITVEVHEKICTTWHAYMLDGRWALKKTTWFKMKCINDTYMKPQREEGIEDIRWMDETQLQKALENTYRNIVEVLNTYRLSMKKVI